MSRSIQFALSALSALYMNGAIAQWAPEWMGTWGVSQWPAFRPAGIRVGADGGIFASAEAVLNGRSYAVLVRFDNDGTFAWAREHQADIVGGLEVLAGGPIALIGMAENVADPAAPAFVRALDANSGTVVWECTPAGADHMSGDQGTQRKLVQTSNGDVLVHASSSTDYVVLRCDKEGKALPEWRWHSGDENPLTTDIVAMADGGVVVTGYGSIGEGYHTVRFDGNGEVLFVDHEGGELGNPLGPAYAAVDSNGSTLLAAAPESTFGLPLAQVWKIAPDGSRLWTTALPNPGGDLSALMVKGILAAPNGDVLISVSAFNDSRLRLMRLDGNDGSLLWDTVSAVSASPTSMALAPNGRVLVVGRFGDGSITRSSMVEFSADGAPCRSIEEFPMSRGDIGSFASAHGWSVLDENVSSTSHDMVVRRYSANGPCDGAPDAIFADSFDSSAMH